MNRNKIIALPLLMLLFQVSCERKNTPEASVVINELLPVNSSTAADQDGEFDDWIEMFNLASVPLDLSGYYITDSRDNPAKWEIPAGTSIPANGYLIIWADKDTTQAGLHANFRLSSAGEKLYFINPELLIIDRVEYDAQPLEIAYARNPDGTGEFVWQTPTYNKSNNN
jgi:hypothetical protein